MTPADDITPEDLEAIQKRCDSATPGPWHEDDGFIHSRPRSDASRAYVDRLMRDPEFRAQETEEQINRPYTLVAQVWQDSPNFDADVEFLKNALADTQRLLAALRRRDAELASKQAALLKVCGELLAAKEQLATLEAVNATIGQDALAERDQARADLAAAKATIATLTEERDDALAEADRRAADSLRELDEAHNKISAITIEEQKWRDSFFAAIANRDTVRLALSAVAGDICDEPYMDGQAPCGCCRSHIKTARRALDE